MAKETAITGITAVMQNYLALAATEAGLNEEQRTQYEHLRMVSRDGTTQLHGCSALQLFASGAECHPVRCKGCCQFERWCGLLLYKG